MSITEIAARSILIKRPAVDSWFLSGYGMNLYRGCTHACVYCDGRDSRYRVDGQFGQDIGVKINALELLEKELDPAGKRRPFKQGFFVPGGGVGDSYQPAEKDYQLTRGALKLMARFEHPVFVLTKSTLVLRDIELLKLINQRARAVVCFSFSSDDPYLSSLFEPGVPDPSSRFEAIRTLKYAGLTCGMFLMPVIPFLSDTESKLSSIITRARGVGIDFIVFGGMTLKPGPQMEGFLNVLRQSYPELIDRYLKLYPASPWGAAAGSYYELLDRTFYRIARREGIAVRAPVSLCRDFVSPSVLVSLIFDQIDYLLKLRGRTSPFGTIARRINQLKTDWNQYPSLTGLPGITPQVEIMIKEILDTGSCRQYQELLEFKDKNDEN